MQLHHHNKAPCLQTSPTQHQPHTYSSFSNIYQRERLHRRVVAKTADFPLDSATGSEDGASSSKCPFLSGQLRTPPMVDLPWLKRVQFQVFHPDKFQKFVLGQRGSDSMVRAPKQLAFTNFYMPATAELVKGTFAEEATGVITQGLSEEGGYTAFSTLLGRDNLLVVKDPVRHAKLRALLQPAFGADAIKSYLPAIQALVARHLEDWCTAGPDGIKAYPCLKMLTFDFILQVVMGKEVPQPELERLSKQFADLTTGLIAWPYLDLPFTPWRRALRAREELVTYFQQGVTTARQQLAAGQELTGVLGRLVSAQDEEGNRLTDVEITSNLLLVLLAGHDTSSTTLTRCLSNLHDNPWVLDKLRAEQAAVQATHGQGISAAALKNMPFAEAVLRETLRRDPVVGAVMRVSTQEFQLGDYYVPPSQTFLLPLRELASHDPRWEGKQGDLDPAKFNPDRLMTPEGQKQGQLMPFGAGARYCLGAALALAEMKVFLALLARSYSFTADNNTEWKPALGFYPANGLPLVLTRM